jgi:hypothetical protein
MPCGIIDMIKPSKERNFAMEMTSGIVDLFYSLKRQKGALHSRITLGTSKKKYYFMKLGFDLKDINRGEDSFAKCMVGRLGVPLQALS